MNSVSFQLTYDRHAKAHGGFDGFLDALAQDLFETFLKDGRIGARGGWSTSLVPRLARVLHRGPEHAVVESATNVVDGADGGLVGHVLLKKSHDLTYDGDDRQAGEDDGNGFHRINRNVLNAVDCVRGA